MKYDAYRKQLGAASLVWKRRFTAVRVARVVVALLCAVLTRDIFAGVFVGLAVFLLFGALRFVPLWWRYIRPMWAVGEAMKAFAQQNGMRYIDSAKPNYKKHFLPAAYRLGMWDKDEQIVKGTHKLDTKEYAFETYVHTFRRMFSREYERVAIRVFSVQLPKELPHIFMRNLQSEREYFKGLPRHFDDDQRVDLEGNFHQKFTVYTHRRTVPETLSLLAPNVMQTLMRSNRQFDIEIVGNKVYFYTDGYFMNTEDLQQSMRTIDDFMKHIEHRLTSWKFVLPNNKHYPYLTSRPGYGTVAIGGTYYNRAWLFIGGYTVYGIVRILADPAYLNVKIGMLIGFDIIMVLVLLVFRRKYQLSKRNVAR